MNKYFPFELHCHTLHSDGVMSPETLVKRAKERNYSGIAITDHNTVSAVEKTFNEGEEQGIIVLKGTEWTTFFGHITCIGKGFNAIDWRDINLENIDVILKKASENGSLLTAAHPKRPGSPICTGCYMDFPITEWQYINAFEVWSQKSPGLAPSNTLAIKMYDSLLQKGYRLSAVYGYDWHREDYDIASYARTFVGAENVNADSIINSIKQGDTYVSTGLNICVRIDGKELPFGSELKSGKHLFDIQITQAGDEFCRINGVNPDAITVTGTAIDSEIRIELNHTKEITLKNGYLRIEVQGEIEGEKNKILLLTSPFYVKGKE